MVAIKVLLLLCTIGSCYCDVPSNVGIIGGHRIPIEDAPFMASLRMSIGMNTKYHWCGGSIVHERFVLTAAHCIRPNRTYDVVVGTNMVSDTGTNGQIYEIEKYIIHRKYNNLTSNFDLCLLKLSTPLQLGSKVKIVDLTDIVITLAAGTMLNVTGWGQTEEHHFSKQLLQVSVPVVDRVHCQLKYLGLKKIISTMLCAGAQGQDSCAGDSGGPLTIDNVQYGVTSFGRGCGINPGVYIKMSLQVRKWIWRTIDKE